MNASLARLDSKCQAVLNDKCLFMLYRTEDMGIADRIKHLRESQKPKKLSQEAFGALCDVSKSAVSQWEAGDTEPDMKSILLLKSKLTFSLDWLLYGEGPKGFGDDIQRTLTLTDEQLEFLNLVKGIKPEERYNWLRLGKSLPKVESSTGDMVETDETSKVESGDKRTSFGTAIEFEHVPDHAVTHKRKTK